MSLLNESQSRRKEVSQLFGLLPDKSRQQFVKIAVIVNNCNLPTQAATLDKTCDTHRDTVKTLSIQKPLWQ